MALKREKHKGGSQPAQAQLKVCHGDGYENIDRAFRIFWYKQERTLAVSRFLTTYLWYNIAAYYLDAAQEHRGCPLKSYTDLGTENGILWLIYTFFLNCRQ